jgi:hypothetical protein
MLGSSLYYSITLIPDTAARCDLYQRLLRAVVWS